MRQGQQNKRMRGRGRKVSNPLNRIYESNGPDVKVRGTASHVAEKYMSLARDAQVSGDPVSSENYLQHAEHYLRIIAAAQAQNQPQQRAGSGQGIGDGDVEMNGAEAPHAGSNGGEAGGENENEEDGANLETALAVPAAPARGRRKRTPAARDEDSHDGATDANAREGKRARRAADDDGGSEGSANGSDETPEAVA